MQRRHKCSPSPPTWRHAATVYALGRLARRAAKTVTAAVCGLVGAVSTSQAQSAPNNTPTRTAGAAEQQVVRRPQPAPAHRLRWDYPRFRPWQYGAIAVQTAGNLYFELGNIPSPGEHWREPLPLDAPVRSLLRTDNPDTQRRADQVSAWMWIGIQYYPVLVDGLLVPLAFDRLNADVAWQLTAINWQTQGLTGIVLRIAHHTVPRARPSLQGCSEEPGAAFPCEERHPGFPSGHAGMATVGAALSCMHHAHLPLYGDGPWGAMTCGLLSAGALAVGVLRIVVDSHWVSDVVVGHALGAGLGLGIPWVLHYQDPITPNLTAIGGGRTAWIPQPVPGGAMISWVGAF